MKKRSSFSVPVELQAKRMVILVLFFFRPAAGLEAIVLTGGML